MARIEKYNIIENKIIEEERITKAEEVNYENYESIPSLGKLELVKVEGKYTD